MAGTPQKSRIPSGKQAGLRLAILLVVVFGQFACSPSSRPPARPHLTALANEAVPAGQLPRNVVPIRYRIQLTVDPTRPGFSGHTEIDVVFRQKRRAIFIDGSGLNVLAASVRLSARHSVTAHYMQASDTGVARLIFVDPIPAGKATLVLDYEAPYGKSLSGLYKVIDKGDAYAFTQFEPTDARRAFPCFDEPGFKTPFQISVTAPKDDRVVSNTPIVSVRTRNGASTTMFQWSKPLPTYLVALAVGPLEIVDGGDVPPNNVRSRPLHLRGIAARGEGARIHYALSLTPKIVSVLEDYFGIAFPFPKLDIIAVPDFGAGAMENAGAITFRERLLLLDPDASLEQKRSSLAVQAHEITHQWFGDLVTPAWWDDTWLNESFASWMEYKVAQAVAPDEQFDTETLRDSLDVMDIDTLPSARAIRQPVHDDGDIENAFDSISYDKGAGVLAMFESFVGNDVFRRGIHAYLTRFAGRSATAANFVETMAAVAGSQPNAKPENIQINIDDTGRINWNGHPVAGMAALMDQLGHLSGATSPARLAAAFTSFLDQPGVPEVRTRLHCEGAVAAHLEQAPYTPIGASAAAHAWRIPVCLGVQGRGRYCRLLDRRSEDVYLGATCPAAIVPNDGGAGYYRFELDPAERDTLIKEIASLAPANQIVLLYSLSSELHSGGATADALLRAIVNVAPTARWDVLATIRQILADLRIQSGLSGPGLASYRAFVSHLFSRRMTEFGYTPRRTESAVAALTREHISQLLISEAHDKDAIATLAPSGEALAAQSRGELPAELWPEALRAGLLSGGKAFATRLLGAYAATNQEVFRRDIVYAFSVSDDPAVLKSLLDLALTPKMRTGEIRYLFQYFGQEPVASAVLWDWYKTNYRALLARLSASGMRRAPGSLENQCDAASRDELSAFFAPKLNTLVGIARPLAMAEERISRCIAFRAAKAKDVATALGAVQ